MVKRMTVDPHCYAFAEAWLKPDGYRWTGDIQRLATQVQDLAENFTRDLDHESER